MLSYSFLLPYNSRCNTKKKGQGSEKVITLTSVQLQQPQPAREHSESSFVGMQAHTLCKPLEQASLCEPCQNPAPKMSLPERCKQSLPFCWFRV